MKRIRLTRRRYALVSDCDAARVQAAGPWAAVPSHRTWYAIRNAGRPQRKQLLHRFILGLDWGDTRRVDHRNRNGLDCQRRNMRIATRFQNQHNRARQKNNVSGYKGVTWHKGEQRWSADIAANRKRYRLGYFE